MPPLLQWSNSTSYATETCSRRWRHRAAENQAPACDRSCALRRAGEVILATGTADRVADAHARFRHESPPIIKTSRHRDYIDVVIFRGTCYIDLRSSRVCGVQSRGQSGSRSVWLRGCVGGWGGAYVASRLLAASRVTERSTRSPCPSSGSTRCHHRCPPAPTRGWMAIEDAFA